MSAALESGLFKVLDARGEPAGAGFLLAPGLGVTCAHVAAAAGAAPGGRLSIAFAPPAGENLPGRIAQALVLPAGWSDPEADDLAFLRLDGPLGAAPPLADLAARAADCAGQAFTAPGFAPVAGVEARRAGGVVGGLVQSGGQLLLQLEGAQFDSGMSGSPVLSLESGMVIGIFRMFPAEPRLKQHFAYATPVERLWANWPPGEPYPAPTDLYGSLKRSVTGYLSGLESFLSFYLGAPGAPAPFGGRQAQFEELDAWLRDGRSAYGLLASPAGRGKSALLAHWAQALVERREARVIFIPISLRFNIHTPDLVYKALALRLSELHREAAPPGQLTSPAQWQEVCRAYLQHTPPPGPPALVILDGLDELAAAPDTLPALFPRPLAPGLKLLASARYLAGDRDEQGWVRRLEWQRQAHSFYLPLLKREGLEEALLALGGPLADFARRPEGMAELFRLTQGDPLLLRLYAEEFRQREAQAFPLDPQELPSIRRGLEGYLERWWQDQQKLWQAEGLDALALTRAVQDFLNLLALADRPLSRDEVVALAGRRIGSRLVLEQITAAAGRLVGGDGSAAAGYVLAHPRLADFFAERMGPKERQFWLKRFEKRGSILH